ncbi:LEA type 2 family protein [Haloarchaeobius sp. HRN-SO-5]|uniref:LEA type 2 family protein n=1 Tax=Haloarchaeobius sp. HRN-SO-5 TaxID=3446118 RepID=UPI003EB9893C
MADGTDRSLDEWFETAKTVLFGSNLRITGVAAVSMAGLVASAYLLGVVGVPAVTDTTNRFGPTNQSTTVIETELDVRNPNPVDTGFLDASAEYEVSLNDITMASGETGSLTLRPGVSTVNARSDLDNEKIPLWWASHVRNDERTRMQIDASIESGLLGRSVSVPQERTISTDILSSFNSTETRPVNASRPLVSDPVLYVNETAAQWGEVTNESTPIVLDFYVYNPKSYDIPVSQLDYQVFMNDVTVGEGTNDRGYLLEAGELTHVRTVTTIDNSNLDEWWVSHLQNDQVTDLRIEFGATVELAGTSLQIPLDQFTYTETIETDIFGTKNGTAGDGDAGTADGSDAGTDAPTTDDAATTTDDAATTTGDDGILGGDDGGVLAIRDAGDTFIVSAAPPSVT